MIIDYILDQPTKEIRKVLKNMNKEKYFVLVTFCCRYTAGANVGRLL